MDSDEEMLFFEENQAKYLAKCPDCWQRRGSVELGRRVLLLWAWAQSRRSSSTTGTTEPFQALGQLCAILDGVLKGLDVGAQRVKFLQSIMRGNRADVASKMELIPEVRTAAR